MTAGPGNDGEASSPSGRQRDGGCGPNDLAGRIAVITGAGSGIGRATALRMARSGANVFVVDVDGDAAAATATAAARVGVGAIAHVADMGREGEAPSITRTAALELAPLVRVNAVVTSPDAAAGPPTRTWRRRSRSLPAIPRAA